MIDVKKIKQLQQNINSSKSTSINTEKRSLKDLEEETILIDKKRLAAKQRKTLTKAEKAELELKLMLEYDLKSEEPIVETKIETPEQSSDEWDVKIGDEIEYFDPTLSYELTGYRPINQHLGLDFNPKLFTVAADTYRENGKYTSLIPGTFKHRNYWLEEFNKCKLGVTIGKYRIPGEYYFFLNYYRLPSVLGKKDASNAQEDNFPSFLAKQYEYFHYLELARKLGMDALVFKCRGIGYSEIIASNLVHSYTFFKKSRNLVSAFTQEYVDATLTKTWQELDFLNTCTEGGLKRLRMKIDTAMRKRSSKLDKDKNETGWMSEIQGIVTDNPRKLRGARTRTIYFEEAGSYPGLVDTYIQAEALVNLLGTRVGLRIIGGCVCAGTKVWTSDGRYINIEDLNKEDGIIGFNGSQANIEPITYMLEPMQKDCYEIITTNGSLKCSFDHPLLTLLPRINSRTKRNATFIRVQDLKVGDNLIIKGNDIFGSIHEDNAYLLGVLFGDGNYLNEVKPILSITTDSQYLLKKYQMYDQVRELKQLPNNIWQWDKQSICEFLAGYYDADGNVQIVKLKHRAIKLTCSYLHVILNIQALLLKLGISSYWVKENKKSRICNSIVNQVTYSMNDHTSYVLYICNSDDIINFRNNIKLKIQEKQEKLDSYTGSYSQNRFKMVAFKINPENNKGEYFRGKDLTDIITTKIKSINYIGKQNIYNLTANNTHTYLSNGFVSANTGGDVGPQLEGLNKMFYNPEDYSILPYKNNYSESGQTVFTGFFIPSYEMWFGDQDGLGFDDRGVVDTERAKKSYLDKWAKIKDPHAVIKKRAEYCFTPEDAFLLEGSDRFDTEALTEQLHNITIHKLIPYPRHIKLHWNLNDEGTADKNRRPKVEFVSDSHIAITELPEEDNDGNVYANLYVSGIDAIDLDKTTSTGQTDVSEFCMVILRRQFGLKSPKVVAIYKERPDRIQTAFDTALKLCTFYNCKALIEATRMSIKQYFEKEHKLDYLMRRPRATANTWGKTNLKQYGVPAPVHIIEHQLDLIEQYIADYCDEILFPSLLQELLKYSFENKRKFDIVAAFGICLLADEDMIGKVARPSSGTVKHLSLGYVKNQYGQIEFKQIENKHGLVTWTGNGYFISN